MRLVNNREGYKYPINFVDCVINGYELEEVDRGYFFSHYIYKDVNILCESQAHLNKGVFYITFPNTFKNTDISEGELKYSFRYYNNNLNSTSEVGCGFLEGRLVDLIKYIDRYLK